MRKRRNKNDCKKRVSEKNAFVQNAPQKSVLELRNFSMAFGDNVLFTNFDYIFEPGIYAFKGPSGVGKSTLMRIIAGLETRYTGDVILNGEKLTSFNPEIHMAHQHYTLFPWLSIFKNTLMVYKGHRVKITDEDRKEAQDILVRLGLGEHLSKLPNQISGGQAQRVSLANTFMNKWSKVVLYDEPTSALDNLNDMLIVDMIKEHQQRYNTIEIIISHEDHVIEGLHAKILEFTPEFRLRPPKEPAVPVEAAPAEEAKPAVPVEAAPAEEAEPAVPVEAAPAEEAKPAEEPVAQSAEKVPQKDDISTTVEGVTVDEKEVEIAAS